MSNKSVNRFLKSVAVFKLMLIRISFLLVLIFQFGITQGQISSKVLLEQSIKHHDPLGVWSNFNDSLFIKTENLNGSQDEILIHMNHVEGNFQFQKKTNDGIFEGYILEDSSAYRLDGKVIESNAILNKLIEAHESVDFFRDYYAYLWGMPMKLLDSEALKSKNALADQFFGESVYKLRVTYPNQVGPEVWYFYFKQEGFALKGIQFYYNEALMDGETILLEGERIKSNIRFSKERTWLRNRNQTIISKEKLR